MNTAAPKIVSSTVETITSRQRDSGSARLPTAMSQMVETTKPKGSARNANPAIAAIRMISGLRLVSPIGSKLLRRP